MLDFSSIYSTDVIVYDYRGYGCTKYSQDPNEESVYFDLDLVISYAVNKLDYKLENIIVWGFSLGSGPAVDFASRFPNLGAIILEAPLASIYILLDSEATKDYNDNEGDIFGNIYKI
jgi:abhydrolase domain-containing protein 17